MWNMKIPEHASLQSVTSCTTEVVLPLCTFPLQGFAFESKLIIFYFGFVSHFFFYFAATLKYGHVRKQITTTGSLRSHMKSFGIDLWGVYVRVHYEERFACPFINKE